MIYESSMLLLLVILTLKDSRIHISPIYCSDMASNIKISVD